ncbi:MAG TPA: LysR substrate-binding domain-containing protein [Steroidobacteraceae bacterium]|jgi:LysR family glycine cleavage system transcriptional activator|nr:LysR substrate-binding domain-containing protein [Steroidobacteraceae bacterium]
MSKYRLPVLNSLRAFEAAARHQSIKIAGDELHVTHAAVSRHIHNLEVQLGRDLFERHHRKIVLTDDGQILLGAVTLAFLHIHRAIERLSGNQSSTRLVISVDPDFAALWLVPRLAEFQSIVADTLVEIIAEKRADSSRNPPVDCAIHYAPAGLEVENGELLFRSRLFPVCAPQSTEAALRSPPDLRRQVLLHDRSVAEWQDYLQNLPAAVDIDVRSGIVFSETALCLDAAARGQGIAIGDDYLAAIYLAEGRLVKPFESWFLSKNAYYFIAGEIASRHPVVKAFRTWLFRTIDGQSIESR